MFKNYEESYIKENSGSESHKMIEHKNTLSDDVFIQAFRITSDFVHAAADSVEHDPNWICSPDDVRKDQSVGSRKYYTWRW